MDTSPEISLQLVARQGIGHTDGTVLCWTGTYSQGTPFRQSGHESPSNGLEIMYTINGSAIKVGSKVYIIDFYNNISIYLH